MTHHSLYLFDGIFFSKIWREQSKRAVACGAATVDQRGGDGRTPLHVAAQWGHHKVVHPGAWCSSSRWGFFFAMLHFRKLLRKLWRIIRWFTGVRCPPPTHPVLFLGLFLGAFGFFDQIRSKIHHHVFGLQKVSCWPFPYCFLTPVFFFISNVCPNLSNKKMKPSKWNKCSRKEMQEVDVYICNFHRGKSILELFF